MKKPYLILFLIFLNGTISFAQIAFTNKIDLLFHPEENMAYYEDGFVNVSTWNLQLFNTKTNVFIDKEWKKIKTTLCKFDDDFSFQPQFCGVFNSQVNVLIEYRAKESKQIILCVFDMQLNLIEEKILVQLPYRDKKIAEDHVMTFLKSPKYNYYILASTTVFKDETKDDKLEYYVLDGSFKEIEHSAVNLPRIPEAEVKYNRMFKNINSIFTLEDGTPLINYDGILYVLGNEGAMKLEIEPEQSISSYQILKKNEKELVLIGTYVEGVDNKKTSGIALITFNAESLEEISQVYTPVDTKFDRNVDELYKEMLNEKNTEGLRNGSKPVLMEATIDKAGFIRAVIWGYGGDHPICNFDILGLNSSGEIVFEKVVSKKYKNTDDLAVVFSEDETVIFAEDHTSNFDTEGRFKPDLKTDYDEMGFNKLTRHIIVFNHETNEFSNKIIEFESANGIAVEYDHQKMQVEICKATHPDEKLFIISRYQPNNTNFGKYGDVYTLIGDLNW